MPLSHARRPLVLLASAYALLLTLLKCWGAFEPLQGERRSRRSVWERLEARVVSPCVESRLGDRVILVAETGRAAGERVQAFLPRGFCDGEAALPGDRVAASGKLRPPRPALMPGDFDEASLLATRDARFILHARHVKPLGGPDPGLGGPDPGLGGTRPSRWTVAAWAERARRSAHRSFRRRLPPDRARLLEGLLFGYKGSLDPELNRIVQDAGVMHLIVPSGAKVGFIVWGLASLLLRAGVPRRRSLLLPALAGGFYCLAVGGESPYLRAYAAGLAGLAAGFWPEREAGGLQAIALSALVLMLLWPQTLFSAGFQMTYAAALGLWLAAPRWRPSLGPRLLRPVWRLVLVSLAVQLALWPLLANIFGRASVAGLLANVILVPASGLYMLGAFLLWTLDAAGAGAPAGAAMSELLRVFESVCAFFAGLPGAAFDPPRMGPAACLAWYLGCAGAFLLPDLRRAAAFGGAALTVCAFSVVTAWARGPRLEACFLGDRKGYATWARLPEGETVLIDAGLAPARLAAALKALGGPVDRLVLTGEDRARTRGLRVTERWTVRRVERGAEPFELKFGRLLLRFDAANGLATVRRGGEIEFCILRHPAAVAPAECFPAGIRGVGYEGAVWIITDGNRYEISSATAGRPLGRPLL